MLTVNLFDDAFAHLSCSVHGKTAKRIRYVRSRLEWDGVTILTDDMLCRSRTLDHLKSRVTVGWLLEPREYKPENYRIAESLLPRLDLLLTHDQELIDRHSSKVKLLPFGGCWIPEAQWGVHGKTATVCQVMSGKGFLQGHILRHTIADAFPEVYTFGGGTPEGWIPYDERAMRLLQHQFAVVVENSRARNFFTEKLLDCFALGTVPIYWGCPNIGDFFDLRGIIPFESIGDLPAILAGLNYESHIQGIRANLERFREFEITDDYLAEHILEKLL